MNCGGECSRMIVGYLFTILLFCASYEATVPVGAPTNPNWRQIPGLAKQIHIAPRGIWGVDQSDHVIFMENSKVGSFSEKARDVTGGEAGVWKVDMKGKVSYRENVTQSNPKGTSWTFDGGVKKFTQIDSGNSGVVYAIRKSVRRVYCLKGANDIKSGNKIGNKWKWNPVTKIRNKKIDYVSCGLFGCYVIASDKTIYFRVGITKQRCYGRRWIQFPHGMRKTKFVKLEVSVSGVLYALDSNNQLWIRQGIEKHSATGTHFKLVPNVKFTHIAVGGNAIGLDKEGNMYEQKGGWDEIPGGMKQIDVGKSQEVWGVSRLGDVMRLIKGAIWGVMVGKNGQNGRDGRHVSSGESGVWYVSKTGNVFFRKQSTWQSVPTTTTFIQLDSGPFGTVYGVDDRGQMFCRGGMTLGKPSGDSWVTVNGPVGMIYVSCGMSGCWGVNSTGEVWYRSDVSCSDTKWIVVTGKVKLKQVEVGGNGEVCGVSMGDVMYHRMGVSTKIAGGTMWMAMNHGVSHVTSGNNGKYLLVNGITYREL